MGQDGYSYRGYRVEINLISLGLVSLSAYNQSCGRSAISTTPGVSWYEAKARIIRGAVRAYIANPMYNPT